VLLGLGGDLDGLLGQHRLGLVPLQHETLQEQIINSPPQKKGKSKSQQKPIERQPSSRAAARRPTLRRTSAAPLATSGDPAPASFSTSDAIPSEQGKNLRDATKASGRRKAPFSSSYPLPHLSFMNFPPSFSFALPWI